MFLLGVTIQLMRVPAMGWVPKAYLYADQYRGAEANE